jgi:hypothetical protein
MSTLGTTGVIGAEILTLIKGEVGKFTQSAAVHSNRSELGKRDNRPYGELEDAEEGRDTNTFCALCQEQVALCTSSNMNKDEQTNVVGKPPRFVGMSNSMTKD